MRAVFMRKVLLPFTRRQCLNTYMPMWIAPILLVAGEGMDEGVLVESEGSAYARYSAFVPFAQEIIRQYLVLEYK